METSGLKAGWKTTEFWGSFLGVVLPIVLGVDPATASTIVAGIVTVYTVARTWIKNKQTVEVVVPKS